MSWITLGEFTREEQALAAARELRARGHRLDLHSPFPVEGAREALGLRPSWVRWVALGGALAGGAVAYLVQWWMNAHDWPLDVGKRPPHSWPAFVLLTYEGLILASALAILAALLLAWRLPNLHHAALGAAGIETATGDSIWVSVEAGSAAERDVAMADLRLAGAGKVQSVEEVER